MGLKGLRAVGTWPTSRRFCFTVGQYRIFFFAVDGIFSDLIAVYIVVKLSALCKQDSKEYNSIQHSGLNANVLSDKSVTNEPYLIETNDIMNFYKSKLCYKRA